MKFYFTVLTMTLGIFILAQSCINEELLESVQNNETVRVSFAIKIPGDGPVTSMRSISDIDESQISTIHVLAFVKDASNNYRYAYQAEGSNLSSISFNVILKQLSNPQIFVLLANSSASVSAANIVQGEELSAVLSRIIASSTTEWPARNGNTLFTPFPMYTKTEPITVTEATTSIGPYSMVRMIARMDVSVKSTVTNFQLVNAFIFNRNTAGSVAFDDSDWDAIDNKVLNANVPGSSTQVKLPTVTYEANASHRIVRSIYTFESLGTTMPEKATALIIGGYFNYPTNQTDISYYRVDIKTADTPAGFVSDGILRNHLYSIEIKNVTSLGAMTPEEAYDNISTISATITPWNLADQNIIFDQSYKLFVNQDKYVFASTGGSFEFTVSTDYPGGLIITTTDPFFTLTENGTADGDLNRTITVSAPLNTMTARKRGTIIVHSNNMNYVIKIEQRDLPNCYFTPPGSTIEFPVIKGFRVWQEEFSTPLSGVVTAELAWQDTPGLITSVGLKNGDNGENSTLQVSTASGLSGNAVVQLKVGGIIRWSWHIWVTNYNPDSSLPDIPNGAYAVAGGNIYRHSFTNPNADFVDYVLMDRNLGAINTTPDNIGSMGMYYQWGRKDPFPGPAATFVPNTSYSYKPIYDMASLPVTIEIATVTDHYNLPNTALYPMKFYVSATTYVDWYTSSEIGTFRDDRLWRRGDGSKAIYDPSPEGWRIPAPFDEYYSPWYDINFPSFTSGAGAVTSIGYYPATGRIEGHSGDNVGGSLWSVGDMGFYWLATAYFNDGNLMLFYPSGGSRMDSYGRSYGFPVRCVKDD